jgi:hypothetical protein
MKRMFLAAVALLSSTGALSSNLLSNGSFESPLVPVGAFSNFATGASLDGWTVVGPQSSIVSTTFAQNGISFDAQDGAQWMDLTGDGSNRSEGVQQSVATVPGQTYQLSFWVGNVNNAGGIFGTTSTVDLEINGAATGAFTNSCTSCTARQSWDQFTTVFVASGTTTMLTFLNGDGPTDNSNGLDNIVLTGPPAAAPEPGTLALLAVGLAAALWQRRRAFAEGCVRRHSATTA